MKIHENIPEDWLKVLRKDWSLSEFNLWLNKIEELTKNKDLSPPRGKIFEALKECSFSKTKVIILGQDPYPTFGHANGLAFSTEDFVQPFPKSLLNIFKELKRSIPSYDFPLTGNLSNWSKQGVLLLNTCLTTEVGVANAHKNKGWEEFTFQLIKRLFEEKEGLVGMFWGKQSQDFAKGINKKGHLILETSHPSPLSVYRGFEGCGHFNACNDFLLKKGEDSIKWQT